MGDESYAQGRRHKRRSDSLKRRTSQQLELRHRDRYRRGEFLSIPNEAIIEEGIRHIVYVQRQGGQYVPVEIQMGIQGELYTAVESGLMEGDQVVSFGSFFVDSEYKLKFAGTKRGG